MHLTTQLHGLLDGGSNSSEYFVERVTYLVHLWNITTDIKHIGCFDYNMFNFLLLACINKAYEERGLAAPYQLPTVNRSMDNSARCGHHFEWREAELLSGGWGGRGAQLQYSIEAFMA